MKPAEYNKLAAMERSSPEDWPLPQNQPSYNQNLEVYQELPTHQHFFSAVYFHYSPWMYW